jgi:hypothetical protein
MIPPIRLDEETSENDVRYSIDDCRKRLRSQRATHRAQHPSPIDVSNGVNASEAPIESYAELLATVSMSQGRFQNWWNVCWVLLMNSRNRRKRQGWKRP